MEASKTMVKAAVDSWLKGVDREKWVTISKIAVPLKVVLPWQRKVVVSLI